jgi:hypothetical protein
MQDTSNQADRLKRLTCNDIIEYILKHKEVEDLEKHIAAIEERLKAQK